MWRRLSAAALLWSCAGLAANLDPDLLAAASKGQDTQVRSLLDKGAGIEAQDRNGRTPLLLAAQHGHAATVRLLLSKGAKPEARDKRGFTAYGLAVFSPSGGRQQLDQVLEALPQPVRPRLVVDSRWLLENLYGSCFMRPEQLRQEIARLKPDALVAAAFQDFLTASGKGLVELLGTGNHGMEGSPPAQAPSGADALLILRVRPGLACVAQQSSDSLTMTIDIRLLRAGAPAPILERTYGGGLKGLHAQTATSAVQYPAFFEGWAKSHAGAIYWDVAEALLKAAP